MGREIKRVALDFNAPLDKAWSGYENPLFKPCPEDGKTCFGGSTAACKWLDAISRHVALICEQAAQAPQADAMRARGMIYPHPYLEEWGQAPRADIPSDVSDRIRAMEKTIDKSRALRDYLHRNPPQLLPMTEELVVFFRGLTGKDPQWLGNGSYDVYVELRAAAKLPETWGQCPVCKGEGIDPAVAEAYEAWERVEPPRGEGWQLWQTVSDGPISPVFATAAELVDWMSQPDTKGERGRFPDMPWAQGWRREVAEKFVNGPGWAPSMVSVGGVVMDGPSAVTGVGPV